jgi:hypothetical protein
MSMNLKTKKAQSAMEYLMTYGWAILIVIIVAAALYALGIFNPATYTGRVPTGFTTLGAPDDWDVDSSGNVRILLNNRLADTITIYNITATMGTTTDTWNTLNCTGTDDYMTIGPGGNADPSTACPLANQVYALDVGSPTAGTTYSVDVAIEYNAGGFTHTESGKVTGTVS